MTLDPVCLVNVGLDERDASDPGISAEKARSRSNAPVPRASSIALPPSRRVVST